MADITMPKMGFDMTEGTIVRWLKQVGDEVKKGEPIAEIETDKVTIEIEAFSGGTLSKIVAEEGAVVPVGGTIAVLGGNGADGADTAAADAAPSATGANSEQNTSPLQAERPGAVASGAATPDQEVGTVTASDAAKQTEAAADNAGGATPQPSTGTGAVPSKQGVEADAEPSPGYGSDVTVEEEATGQPKPTDGAATGAQTDGGHTPASPVAKRLARENNVNIAQITGSGPGGRIVRRDVEQFVSSGGAAQQAGTPAPTQTAPAQSQPAAQPQPAPAPAQPAVQPAPAQAQPAVQPAPAQAQQAQPAPAQPQAGTRREPMSRLRQTIARRLVQSKGPVPHFYVTTEIDMGAVVELRKQLNASGDVKITINDLVVKAAAIAMKKFPVLNASFAEDAILYHDYVHVSIAVATDNGLLAPAVTDVDKKSLGTISTEAKELISRTRSGKATPDELQRGTFSVSNLGMYPVDSFVAIINPPQAAIIAVGAIAEQPVVRDGQIVVGQIMKATISIDHRVSDGAVGAEYMQELKRLLENPMLILL
ncbi:MAG: 2-oxo acid dehydrogenase subunit E2 [Chloroflexota bacterium]|nr:2-oxo acid dehydrogenase subunit E2 [Chloroflexota bacterium]